MPYITKKVIHLKLYNIIILTVFMYVYKLNTKLINL